MSNLLKSFSLVCDNDGKRIIDSNEAVAAKLEQIRKIITSDKGDKKDFSLGLNPENVEELLAGADEQKIIGSDETAASCITDEEARVQADEILAQANEHARAVMDGAQRDAERIIADAQNQAEKIKSDAYQKGIVQGKADGEKKLSDDKARLEQEFDEKNNKLLQEYEEKRKKMEPELIDVILDVFSDVTKVLAEDYDGMIMSLVDKVLSGTESSDNYIIRVSKEDAGFLRENRENILRKINRDVHLEIVEDVSMRKNECLIDTDTGIYDCSLDIQLENLIKSIKILSSTSDRRKG